MCPDLWITSLLFDVNCEIFNGSCAVSPGIIYILYSSIPLGTAMNSLSLAGKMAYFMVEIWTRTVQ